MLKGKTVMETSKNNKVASGFLKQGSILAVASILVRLRYDIQDTDGKYNRR